jgi:hypothetical protein
MPDIVNGLATVAVLYLLLGGLLAFFFLFGARH